jgi:glycosyltransferase involved in cell wall biosynthesis
MKDDVVKYISAAGLNDKVNFIGNKPNAELPAYLNSSDVYLSTSLSDGTSLSLLEAMACGLGLVLTDVPAIREWAGSENGIIIPRDDPDAVADALDKYYLERGLIERHGAHNIKIASMRADWDKNYELLRKIYSELIAIEKKS